ncbi:hypothetical protein AB0B50_22280 [Streptomyces sp. NPDC041068]|uniref:hypothetical protein n=1 Tax=Streptomyces sp. NPDC041068 TaxID=3155130 RepID=UPI0033CACA7E
MFTGLVTDFGRRLADRWATTLVMPGLVFTAVAAAALTLRQSHWSDLALLRAELDKLTAAGSGSTRTAVLLLVVLAASFAAGLLAEGLAGPYERVVLGRWPRPLNRLARALTERRRAAWRERDEACLSTRLELAEAQADSAADTPEGRAHVAELGARLGVLEADRNQLSLGPPRSPTWTGDRMNAPADRTRREYRLELADAWPRLWLLLPDTTRQPLTESRQRFDEAMRLGGWSALYLLLGAVWWPAAVAGAGAGLVAWRRGRERAEEYAELVESAVDVHLQELFEQFDEETRPIRPSLGAALTERFRKGAGPRHH